MNAVPDATMYVTSLREILWGVMLVASTMIIHGFGMILTLRVNNAFKPRLERTHSFVPGVFALSNYNLPHNWRLLEGMIATAGLLGFAWSTGVLLTLAQGFQEHQLRMLKQRQENRLSKSADRRS